MADEATGNTGSPNEENEVLKDVDNPVLKDVDKFLLLFARMAERGLSFPITVWVGGRVISGDLVGTKEYFKKAAERYSQSNTVGAHFSSIIAEASRLAETKTPPSDFSDIVDSIHMVAPAFIGEPIPNFVPMLWRCKITSVDAFALGKITVEPY